MNLLKTKLSIHFVKDTFFATLLITLILILFSTFFIFVGKSTGDKVLSSIDGVTGMITMFWIVCMSASIAHLCNRHIVYSFITKRINLIYTYPYTKKEHLNSNILLIIIEIFVIGLITCTIFSCYIFIAYSILYKQLNYDIISYATLNLITLSTLIISVISFVFISYKFKTSSIIFFSALGYSVFQTLTISGFNINHTFELTKLLLISLLSTILYFNIDSSLWFFKFYLLYIKFYVHYKKIIIQYEENILWIDKIV